MKNYINSKFVKLSELEGFSANPTNCKEGQCGVCHSTLNTMSMNSEAWTSAVFCWKCESLTVTHQADKGPDFVEVYT